MYSKSCSLTVILWQIVSIHKRFILSVFRSTGFHQSAYFRRHQRMSGVDVPLFVKNPYPLILIEGQRKIRSSPLLSPTRPTGNDSLLDSLLLRSCIEHDQNVCTSRKLKLWWPSAAVHGSIRVCCRNTRLFWLRPTGQLRMHDKNSMSLFSISFALACSRAG